MYFLSVAKPIIGSDVDRDLNLDDDLYVLLARREALIQSGSGSNILTSPHDSIGNRFMSDNLTNPVTAGGERRGGGVAGVRNALTRAHGILMLLAWPLLALSGIFFASWMKPALPNGEWFQVCYFKHTRTLSLTHTHTHTHTKLRYTEPSW